MGEICIRLKWYLNLCKDIINLSINGVTNYRANYYIARYLIVIITILIMTTNRDNDIKMFCPEDILRKSIELGMHFFHGEYSYADNSTVLNVLEILCPCVNKYLKNSCSVG